MPGPAQTLPGAGFGLLPPQLWLNRIPAVLPIPLCGDVPPGLHRFWGAGSPPLYFGGSLAEPPKPCGSELPPPSGGVGAAGLSPGLFPGHPWGHTEPAAPPACPPVSPRPPRAPQLRGLWPGDISATVVPSSRTACPLGDPPAMSCHTNKVFLSFVPPSLGTRGLGGTTGGAGADGRRSLRRHGSRLRCRLTGPRSTRQHHLPSLSDDQSPLAARRGGSSRPHAVPVTTSHLL